MIISKWLPFTIEYFKVPRMVFSSNKSKRYATRMIIRFWRLNIWITLEPSNKRIND
jgi:hypothetical protein